MKMYSKEGNEMMHIKAVWREGDNIVTKGKIMEAMSISIYLRPEDVWNAKSLLKWNVLWYLPIIIVKGFFRSLKKKSQRLIHN